MWKISKFQIWAQWPWSNSIIELGNEWFYLEKLFGKRKQKNVKLSLEDHMLHGDVSL